jgi:hypothetical protein
MNKAPWFTESTSFWSNGVVLQYFDDSDSYLAVLNAHWLQAFLTVTLFCAVALGLYLSGRFVPPQVQPFTHRRNSHDLAKQHFSKDSIGGSSHL